MKTKRSPLWAITICPSKISSAKYVEKFVRATLSLKSIWKNIRSREKARANSSFLAGRMKHFVGKHFLWAMVPMSIKKEDYEIKLP